MSAIYPGMITVIHDPADDPEITHAALAAHDPGRGQVTVHPTVGTDHPVTFAYDVLAALGARITATTATDQQIGAANRAYAAAAAWLTVDRTEVVIVLRAHLLSATARQWLARLASAAEVRMIVIWHGRRREDWASAFRHPPNLVREHDDLDAALAGARTRPHPPAPAPCAVLPDLCALPVTGLARFRADARRVLPAAQFSALDAHYRTGLQSACRWITGHHLSRTLTAARVPASGERPVDHGVCLGHALGRARSFPRAFTDLAELEAFLSELANHSPAPAATIARVRGAQAGLLLHGIALHVPLDLAECRGPGLTGLPVTEQVATTIRREAANPLIAAALTLVLFTGLSAEEVINTPPAEAPEFSHEIRTVGGAWHASLARYTIPGPARPILAAAAFFQRQVCRPTSNLIDGVTVTQVQRVAQAAGIDLPAKPVKPDQATWHALARAWSVADALHQGAPCAAGPGPVAL